MPCPLLIFSQSDYLIQVVDINSNTEWQTEQVQISWLLKKPTDLDLHCWQRQGISGFSRLRIKILQPPPYTLPPCLFLCFYFHSLTIPFFVSQTPPSWFRISPSISIWTPSNFIMHFPRTKYHHENIPI